MNMHQETVNVDEIANALVTAVIKQVVANLSELTPSICHWEPATFQGDNYGSSAGCLPQQKVHQQLEKFFSMRRVFSEHCGDMPEAQELNEEQSKVCKDSERQLPSASSSYTTIAFTEAAKMIVSQVIDHSVRTLQSTEAVRTTSHIDMKFKKPSERHVGRAVKHSRVSTKPNLSSTPLQLFKEEEGTIENEVENFQSPISVSSIPSPNQVDDVAQPEIQPQAETVTGLVYRCSQALEKVLTEIIQVWPIKGQEEYDETETIRLSPRSEESRTPCRLSEENGNTVFSQQGNDAEADRKIVLYSHTFSDIIRRFFHSLSEEQWKEISEGVYNCDVKEHLIGMCKNVMRLISDSVITMVLPSIHQLSTTSVTFGPRGPLSCEHLMEYFSYNIQSRFESSFRQALYDIVGEDTPVRISPEFKEAMAGDVIYEVNTTLSVGIQRSMDGGSTTANVAASNYEFKDTAAKKTLAGAITTMQSFLTGRGGTVVKRRILLWRGLDTNIQEEKAPRGPQTEKNASLWRRFFSARQRETIQPVQVKDRNEAVMSTHSVGKETFAQISSSQCLSVEVTKPEMKCGVCCFENFFSKDEKKRKEKEKKGSQSKQRPLWMQFSCSSYNSCCFDH